MNKKEMGTLHGTQGADNFTTHYNVHMSYISFYGEHEYQESE